MYNNNYHPDDYRPEPVKRRRRRKPRNWPMVVAALLFLVAVFGVGMLGGQLSYNRLASQSTEPGAAQVTAQEPVVLYQTAQTSVTRESAASDLSAYEQVVLNTAASVVEISTESMVTNRRYGSYIESGAGSGVIISQDGYVVTNNHVISGATTIIVRTQNGDEYTATLIGTDEQTDLAVLKIDAAGLTPAVFGDSDAINVGQAAVAIGNPLGSLGGTVTEGIISSKDREIVIDGDVMNLIQTSAAINPGNSGGGLFNLNGELIGVVNAKSSGSEIEGLGFAIPSNTAKAVIPQLIEHGYVTGRPMLGIEAALGTPRSSRSMYGWYDTGYGSDYGLYITQVYADNGLESYDQVLSVDGVEVSDVSDISRIVQNKAVGDTVKLTIQRGGSSYDVDVQLIERGSDYSSSDVL